MNSALEIVVNNKDNECNIDATKTYTTMQAAKICGVSQGTIYKLFDRGYLKGFKVPLSGYRKILGNSLIKFIKKNGIDEYLGEKIYTTGKSAKICRIGTKTIIRYFDNKMLKGYRITGTSYRFIPRKCLIEFMKENGMYEYLKDNLCLKDNPNEV